jgi:cysteine desulfurase
VGQMDGAGHEQKLRSGTLNVPGIVGFAAAVEIMVRDGEQENRRLAALRDRLCEKLMGELPHVTRNGDPEHALPGNLNLSFHYVEGEGLMLALSEMALSSGSACTSATLEPSYVLGAMGVDKGVAHCSIRFGLGRSNDQAQIDYVAERVIAEVTRLRAMSPLYDMVLAGIDPNQLTWSDS